MTWEKKIKRKWIKKIGIDPKLIAYKFWNVDEFAEEAFFLCNQNQGKNNNIKNRREDKNERTNRKIII